ncbi:MAG TPA: outer membrane protein assembly factor BamE [Methylovirgula sp.]|jgi:outer membrane protein assembly factor BamE (lipoprotein component of BamABCDE complex)|nr:outer membrane protein assembly factor BamE [Methylovirgula sp.]
MKPSIAARSRKTATARQKTILSSACKFVGAAALALSLAGCLGMGDEIVHGYQVDPRLLDQVKIGSSAEQALVVMGTPSTTSTVGGDAWYYITQVTKRPVQFMDPTMVDQRVLAVYFDKQKKVTRIANYGMKDGKIFDFISRTTPTGGADSSILNGLMKSSLRLT